MFERQGCSDCELHLTARPSSRCLKGEGGIEAKLAIFLDAPHFMDDRRGRSFISDSGALLKWMLRRMSLNMTQVYIDYIVKCYPKKLPKQKAARYNVITTCAQYRFATLQHIRPKEIVALGTLGCEAFLGTGEIKDYQGTNWVPREEAIGTTWSRVWIGYSIAYALQSPSEAHSIFGLIWQAAEAAELNPQINETIPPFDWSDYM